MFVLLPGAPRLPAPAPPHARVTACTHSWVESRPTTCEASPDAFSSPCRQRSAMRNEGAPPISLCPWLPAELGCGGGLRHSRTIRETPQSLWAAGRKAALPGDGPVKESSGWTVTVPADLPVRLRRGNTPDMVPACGQLPGSPRTKPTPNCWKQRPLRLAPPCSLGNACGVRTLSRD